MKNKSDLKDTRQFQNVRKKPRFVNIPYDWCTRFGLSPTEILVYATVANFSRLKNNAYTGSVQGLQAYWNISRATALRTLEKLLKRGFIGCVEFGGGRGKRTAYINLIDRKEGAPPIEEQLETNAKKYALASAKNILHDI